MKNIIPLLSILLLGTTAGGENTNPVEALPYATGIWEGEGWIKQGANAQTQKFRSSEVVERRAGGKIVTIIGRHVSTDSADKGKVLHEAFAVVSPAADGKSYRFQSYLATGQNGDYQGRVENGRFIWEIPDPRGGRVRFTAHVQNDQWHEIGQYSPDGSQWHDFFAMTLKRVSQGAKACK
jgi:hypothetical protein